MLSVCGGAVSRMALFVERAVTRRRRQRPRWWEEGVFLMSIPTVENVISLCDCGGDGFLFALKRRRSF